MRRRAIARSDDRHLLSAVAWLVAKEWRELVASRAWWVLLFAMGPLVGVSFISAVWTYAEASGLNGTSVGVGEAFAPLVGVLAPTFSACELAAAFLLPFVAIRLVAGDRQSGALKLELQRAVPAFVRISAKGLVLFIGWLIASLAPGLALVLWKTYGGVIYVPELAAVVSAHLLNAGLTIALAASTASLTDHPSTAAIVTLCVTVGTWIVNFVAAVHGGIWERIWYELDGRKAMSRVTTAEGVETIFALAGVMPPAGDDDAVFRGHPLPVAPKGAATVFYGVWPTIVAVSAFAVRGRQW